MQLRNFSVAPWDGVDDSGPTTAPAPAPTPTALEPTAPAPTAPVPAPTALEPTAATPTAPAPTAPAPVPTSQLLQDQPLDLSCTAVQDAGFALAPLDDNLTEVR